MRRTPQNDKEANVRWLGVALVAIASAGLIAVSVCVNYAFGSSFGTGLEAHAYGCAFAFADVLKTAAPIAARRSLASRSWGAALIASLAWAIFTTGSAISAVGFASANRTITVDSRKVQAALNRNRLASLEADQSELRRLRERLGTHEVVQERASTADCGRPATGGGDRRDARQA